MCGICGKVYLLDEKAVETSTIKNMCRRLKHRGPDSEGTYINKNVGLGVTRLEIIDPQGGTQPFSNEDNSLQMVFNGEVYNYLDLRRELISKGHIFKSNCDTEVVIHLYEEVGDNCINRLNGMFAFAIWDAKKKKMLLARDKFGIKPLYYAYYNDSLIFASEIKALLVEPDLSKTMDNQAIWDLFSYGYIPSPLSPFLAIKKLPAASILVASREGINVRCYWQLDIKEDTIKSEEYYREEIEFLLEEAVKKHLTKNIPLGIFLSGGIDSSLIAYYAAKNRKGIWAFNLSFDEPSFDESKYARFVANYLGLSFVEFKLKELTGDFILEMFNHNDSLVVEPAILATYYLSKQVSDRAVIILSGEGGDEIFGGYETYRANKFFTYYLKLPHLWRRCIIPGLLKVMPVPTNTLDIKYRARLFVKGGYYDDISHAAYSWREIFSEDEKRQLIVDTQLYKDIRDSYAIYKNFFEREGDVIKRSIYVDINLWLADDVLSRIDLMTSAFGLEARVPMLDIDLLSTAMRIPAKYKVRFLKTKVILRNIACKYLPAEISGRRKHGFSVPISKWLRTSLRDFLHDIINKDTIRDSGLLNWSYVERIISEHESFKADHSRKIWCILAFLIWHKRYIKG